MAPKKRAKVSTGRHAADENNPVEGQWIPGIRPSTDTSGKRRNSRPRHAAPDVSDPAPRKRAAKRAPASTPVSSSPVTSVLGPSSPPARRRNREGVAVASDQATEYARRAAIRATSGKPSVTGRAVAGTAAGASTGAALGTVVPGIGNAVGAGAGAVVGAGAGVLSGHRAKKEYRSAMRGDSAGPRKLLLAEFAVCATVAALSPLTDKNRSEGPGAWMKRMTAIMGLFFILALISAAGRGSAKIAAGLGGLVAIVLLVSERDLFTKLATVFASPSEGSTNSRSVGVTEQMSGTP